MAFWPSLQTEPEVAQILCLLPWAPAYCRGYAIAQGEIAGNLPLEDCRVSLVGRLIGRYVNRRTSWRALAEHASYNQAIACNEAPGSEQAEAWQGWQDRQGAGVCAGARCPVPAGSLPRMQAICMPF